MQSIHRNKQPTIISVPLVNSTALHVSICVPSRLLSRGYGGRLKHKTFQTSRSSVNLAFAGRFALDDVGSGSSILLSGCVLCQ